MSAKYKISNWKDYNIGLISRGNPSKVFDLEQFQEKYTEEANNEFKNKNKRRGQNKIYTYSVVLLILFLQQFLKMPLRQTQGFVEFLFKILGIKMKVPSYVRICQIRKSFDLSKITLDTLNNEKEDLSKEHDVAIDSSGMKLFSQNDWSYEKHNKKKRKDWAKTHVMVDVNSKQILEYSFTTNKVGDASEFKYILESTKYKLNLVMADGAYDTTDCLRSIIAKNAKPIIPPRSNAILHNKENEQLPKELIEREKAVQFMNTFTDRKEGRDAWKKSCEYHKRSIVENCFYRLKITFGEVLREKIENAKNVTIKLRCALLNRFIDLARPFSCSCKLI